MIWKIAQAYIILFYRTYKNQPSIEPYNNHNHNQKFKVNSAEYCSHCTEKTRDQEKKDKKRYVFSLDLNVDNAVDGVTSGGRAFHVRDAAAGKARSPIVPIIAMYLCPCLHCKYSTSLFLLIPVSIKKIFFDASTWVCLLLTVWRSEGEWTATSGSHRGGKKGDKKGVKGTSGISWVTTFGGGKIAVRPRRRMPTLRRWMIIIIILIIIIIIINQRVICFPTRVNTSRLKLKLGW